jgi:hypothetical protein
MTMRLPLHTFAGVLSAAIVPLLIAVLVQFAP